MYEWRFEERYLFLSQHVAQLKFLSNLAITYENVANFDCIHLSSDKEPKRRKKRHPATLIFIKSRNLWGADRTTGLGHDFRIVVDSEISFIFQGSEKNVPKNVPKIDKIFVKNNTTKERSTIFIKSRNLLGADSLGHGFRISKDY